jgi:hypothetical protein
MVKEVGASDDPKDFDRAFTKVVQGKRVTRDQTQRPHSKPPISRDTRGRQ